MHTCNEELQNVSVSPDIIRRNKEDAMGRACSTSRREEKCMQSFGMNT
jgi:hypothetical protein